MTRIDFYILNDPALEARSQFAVKLAEKLYRNALKVHLHSDDSVTLHKLDERLWTARDVSFIPHEISATPQPHCPLTLSIENFSGTEGVLINMGSTVPDFFSHFTRVVEIINAQAPDVGDGRKRYRFYRDRGYKLNNHEIN
ncbi:MAG TPA: DNA polymerase III subunit chi [Gammaproteobacteria bacterium]|nr:DNA polymerase III subunit chi [Gammaproteobacteria bacterium]